MLKKLIFGALGLIVLIIGIILVRTFSYGGEPVGQRVELPDTPVISADSAAQHLSEIIQFKTVTLSGGDPRPGQDGEWLALHDWLSDTYPAAHAAMTREIVPGTLTLLYTWRGSDPSLKPILLMAHQDVVPVNMGTESDWTGAPFAGEIIDGYIYGRGAIDDKGNLVGLMEAADALAASGFQPKRTVLFIFGHDEEVLRQAYGHYRHLRKRLCDCECHGSRTRRTLLDPAKEFREREPRAGDPGTRRQPDASRFQQAANL